MLLKTLDYLRAARRLNLPLTQAEAHARAEADLKELSARPDRKQYLKVFEETAPTSRSVLPSQTEPDADRAAVLWLPVVRWLCAQLLAPTNRRVPAAKRGVVLATFLFMAFAKVRPEVWATKKSFERGHTLRSWSFDYPEGVSKSKHLYESLSVMLAHRDPQMVIHINRQGHPRRPRLQADRARRPGHHAAGHLGDRPGVRARADRRLASARRAAPPVAGLPGAHPRRRRALTTRRCSPTSSPFHAGVRPCFPQGEKKEYAEALHWRDSGGIPKCLCGDLIAAPLPERDALKFKDHNGHYWDAEKRRKEEKTRWRFTCVHYNPRCKDQGTMPVVDSRLYGFYHRDGSHLRAIQRSIYLLRRNAVESVFATLQENGLGGKRLGRADWADDHEMDWLLSCGLMYLTARRLVHETGLYADALEEADTLGLLDQPTLTNPAPGPDELSLARVRRERFQRIGEPRPPSTWPVAETSVAALAGTPAAQAA